MLERTITAVNSESNATTPTEQRDDDRRTERRDERAREDSSASERGALRARAEDGLVREPPRDRERVGARQAPRGGVRGDAKRDGRGARGGREEAVRAVPG